MGIRSFFLTDASETGYNSFRFGAQPGKIIAGGEILDRNEAEEIQVAGGTIEVTPAWRFLLNPPES